MIITPKIFERFPNVLALQTTRRGGVSPPPFASLNVGANTSDDPLNIQRNKQILCRRLGIAESSLVSSEQVHGADVLLAVTGGEYSGYDAFITKEKDIFLCIFTADCFPVLIYDYAQEVVGAAHAGWKGTAANIAGKTVAAMKKAFGTSPQNCCAFIGAGISGSAYEVGKEVACRFEKKYITAISSGNRFLLDLAAANRDQLIETALPRNAVEVSPFCTVRNNTDFFSYRKDEGCTGRMVALIGIKGTSIGQPL